MRNTVLSVHAYRRRSRFTSITTLEMLRASVRSSDGEQVATIEISIVAAHIIIHYGACSPGRTRRASSPDALVHRRVPEVLVNCARRLKRRAHRERKEDGRHRATVQEDADVERVREAVRVHDRGDALLQRIEREALARTVRDAIRETGQRGQQRAPRM